MIAAARVARCSGARNRLCFPSAARASSGLAEAPAPRGAPWAPLVSSRAGGGSLQHRARPVELAEVSGMRSSELRKLSQAAAAEGADPALWEAIATRCEDFSEQMRHWDIVHVLQAFAEARVENRQLFLRFADALCAKTSKFAPKQLLDAFAVYESFGLRPRELYLELFHVTIRLSRSMYAEELSLSLQCFARHQLGNPTVVAHLVSATLKQIRDFRLRYLCSITGALGSLRMVPDTMLTKFDEQARFEVQTVPMQELLENLQAFPQLEFSWRPYEELCLQQFIERLSAFQTAADVGQLADPFEAMYFLRAKGLLEKGFLEALTQWCLAGVHRPNVCSERRPTARQLAQLYDWCREYDLESSPALRDAIGYYVESGGGQWQPALQKPLRYQRKRRYVKNDDPAEHLVTTSSVALRGSPRREQQSAMQDLPGLPASDDQFRQPVASEWDLTGEEPAAEDFEVPRSNRKKCGGETTNALISSSRKSSRPRHRRDPGARRDSRKNWTVPIFMQPGFCSRPKYQPGVSTVKYPWSGIPAKASKGVGWVHRR